MPPKPKGCGKDFGLVVKTGNHFNCPVCSYSTTYSHVLKNHLLVHTRERPFSCDLCSKSFSQKGNLQTHMRLHTGVKPYECKTCKQRFTQKSALLHHHETFMHKAN